MSLNFWHKGSFSTKKAALERLKLMYLHFFVCITLISLELADTKNVHLILDELEF